MIRITFLCRDKTLSGVVLDGHSGFSESGTDIVCAAVSSAVYMTANTITEILNVEAKTDVKDGYFRLEIPVNDTTGAQLMMEGLQLHLTSLLEQYPDHITIAYSEV